MRRLIGAAKDYQLKFVVGQSSQLAEVDSIVRQLAVGKEDVFIMPQGVSVADMDAADQWLRPLCEAAGYRYCDRMQIRWYGNRRGT